MSPRVVSQLTSRLSVSFDGRCADFSEELNATYPDGRGSVYPEQFTAAQIHEKNVHLTRAMWGYCRVDEMGQCRYAGEVDNLLTINEGMAKVIVPHPRRRYADRSSLDKTH